MKAKKIVAFALSMILMSGSAQAIVRSTPFPEGKGLFAQGLIPVSQGEKWGAVDQNGKTVIPVKYDSVGEFEYGLAVIIKDGKRGFVDANGKTYFSDEYDVISIEGAKDSQRILVGKLSKDGNIEKVGFADLSGKLVIPMKFDNANPFQKDGMTAAQVGDKWGLINTKGDFVLKPAYEVMDQGTSMIDFVYNQPFDKTSGLTSVKQNGKWGYVDKTGKMVIKPSFTYAANFENDIAYVWQGEKKGIIDTKGNYIIEAKYDDVIKLKDNSKNYAYALVGDKKLVFLDKNKKQVAQINDYINYSLYNIEKNIELGMFTIEKDGKVGVSDIDNKVIIKPQYESLDIYQTGNIKVVTLDKKDQIIDKTGKVIWTEKDGVKLQRKLLGITSAPDEFTFVGEFHNDMANFTKDQKTMGFVDKTYKIVIPEDFEWSDENFLFSFFEPDYAVIKKNGKYGIIDRTGKIIVQPQYDSIPINYEKY